MEVSYFDMRNEVSQMAYALFLSPLRTGFLLPLGSHVNSGSNLERSLFCAQGLFSESSEEYVVYTPSFHAAWHWQPQKIGYNNSDENLREFLKPKRQAEIMHTHFCVHVCAWVPCHGFAYWFDMNISLEIKVFKITLGTYIQLFVNKI